MQERTVRRRACSAVITRARAPSWVRGRGFGLKMFRRMVRLLSKKIPAGEKSDTEIFIKLRLSANPDGRFRTCAIA
jgi:hypothetical protein